MFILLKSLARSLILPPSGPLVIAVLGLLLISRRRRLGVVLVVIGVGSLWLCATPVVSDVLTRFAERYPSLDLSKPVNAQAIVVLGGGGVRMAPEYGGPALEGPALARVNYAAFLAHRTSLPVAVSGSPDEAQAMSTVLSRDFGITVRWAENESGDTYENARFSARLLQSAGIHRILLVTDSTHEWRAVHEFMGAGFDVVPAPVGGGAPRAHGLAGFIPHERGLSRSSFALYEMIGEAAREFMAVTHLRRQQALAGGEAPTGGAVPSGGTAPH
jgi:uncharacterized SAM-binding protein YcdF (DUF218 family)